MTDNNDNGHMTKLVAAYLQDQTMQQLESYLKCGRVLEIKSAEELKERWIDLFRELAELNYTHETERHDIEAELTLRKDEPPYDLVTAEMEYFTKKVDAGLEEWRQGPNRNEDEEGGFLADFRSFLDGLDKPSN